MDNYIIIPTYDNGIWSTTSFATRDQFKEFLTLLLKEPGKYNFDNIAHLFNEQARVWHKNKVYCIHPFRSIDYIKYWDDQKDKCRNGVLFKSNGNTWYISRDYYMWLNFLPIFDKERAKYDFPQVWDSQYHLALYELLAELNYKHIALLKKRQWGSQQPHTEEILTASGWSTMGEVKEGDLLWNPDGTLTKILHKINNGRSDVYEFVFSDGRKTRAGIEHNWEVYDRKVKKIKILNTKQLIDLGLFSLVTAPIKLGIKKYKAFRFGIKQTQALPFEKQTLNIDPYVLGYLLGNGSFGKNNISVTSNDREVEEEFKKILGDKYLFTINSKTRNCYRHNITYIDRFNHPEERQGINSLIRQLNFLNLKGVSCCLKFIPKIYLKSSIEDRINLLQGLMDSDGYINSLGKDIHYTTVSPQLAKDVEYLCRSLGISCITNKKNKQKSTHMDFYRIRLSGNIPFNIFRLKRKLDRQKNRKLGFELSNIISITKLDYQEESSCIVVDNPNHLYITKDFIVTHNSYFHASKLINQLWFEEGVTMKMGASHKDYINEKGTWKFLNEYRSFLDEHTAWYRPMNPGKVMMWQQQIEITKNNRKSTTGNKGTIQGITFDKDATNSVGGPCLTAGHYIWMANGSLKLVEEITTNDIIMGADGKPKKIKRVFTGVANTYTINQKRGMSYTVTEDHLLYLKYRDVNVKECNRLKLLKPKEWLELSDYKKRVIVGVKNNKPLEFPEKPVFIDPYYLGLWLGDGFRESTGMIVNSSLDPEIVEYISKYAKELDGELHSYERIRSDYNYKMLRCHIRKLNSGKRTNFNSNILIPCFVKYNLFYNKHIPKDYLQNSKEVRLQLLAGLIDSDGYYDKDHGHFVIGTSNYTFAKELQLLGISLGFTIRIYKAESKAHYKIKASTNYAVNFLSEDSSIIPTKVKRKQSTYRSYKSKHTTPISIISKGVDTYYGFECEDNLFLLEDGTITHNCRYFFHEEAGIAPKMDTTYEYLLPALRSGQITTGTFIAAGSVGDLDQCEPLKQMIMYPEANSIYEVETNLLDEKSTIGKAGLFIPEQWSMPPFIDQYGNSLVEDALKAIKEERIKWKKDLSPEMYQLRISQHPINIEEAFAFRKTSIFPAHLVLAQQRRIEEKTYAYEFLDLEKDAEGKIQAKGSNKLPIKEFPITKNTEDKTGVLVVWERPIKDPSFGMYYASIDPVSEGRTTSSESLVSIYVYKNPVEVTREGNDGLESFIERDKIVAAWCGRFDDINETHKKLEMIIEWYNAWTVIENNISLFIQYMISKRKQRYLVPKDQILFLKDLGANANVYQEYGWKNTGVLFKTVMISYAIEFLTEVLDTETKTNGDVVKTIYGVERIPDPMLLVEMLAYQPGVNVDRLVSFGALIAFAKVQQANRGLAKRVEENSKNKLQNPKDLYTLNKGYFNKMGRNNNPNLDDKYKIQRNPFKNLK